MRNFYYQSVFTDSWEFTLLAPPEELEDTQRFSHLWPFVHKPESALDTKDYSQLVKLISTKKWLPAQVPGVVHYDLVREGILDNPFESSESAKAAWWVSESDWVFRTYFNALQDKWNRAILRFDGIDTFSDIYVNGEYLGSTENAYRVYEFELPSNKILAKGNELLVHIKAHGRMIDNKREDAKRMDRSGSVTGLIGKSLIRRYQRSFFSTSSLLNLGTGVLGIGLNNNVSIHLFSDARIEDVWIQNEILTERYARINIQTEINSAVENVTLLSLVVSIYDENCKKIQSKEKEFTVVHNQHSTIVETLEIQHPKFWWPSGYGNQSLYTVKVLLLRGKEVLSIREVVYGFKDIELVTKHGNGKPAFYFLVNNKKIYARGFNILPIDYLKVHGKAEDYLQLFETVAASGANMIRFWGGGAVVDDLFYEYCDKYGLLIWQDFFLHSNVYPDYDQEFVKNFSIEAGQLVKRIRNRASLAILCGGNEQYEGWEEWGWKEAMDRFYGETLVTEVLPKITKELCPDIPYVINSPHGLPRAQSPVAGDMHNWGNYFNSTKDPQFVTETCWSLETYSRPETLKKIMGLDVDLFNERGWFNQWSKITGLSRVIRFHYSSYFDVSSLRAYLRSLEIEQALADYYALSNFRLHSSSCSGILYWSLNKGGPLFQYGCLDISDIR